MYIILIKSSIKPLIAGILKYAIILVCNNSSLFCSTCEARIMLLHFATEHKSLFFLLREWDVKKFFRPARLDSKICLSLCYNWFRRIRVLHGKITYIAAHKPCFYLSFSGFTYRYHFVDLNEMMIGVLVAISTGIPCFSHDFEEITIVRIRKRSRKLTR